MDLPMQLQQRIELCVEELLLLRSAPSLRIALEVCFLYGSDEAFHALCSLLLFGKDLCSPNKRIKAEAKLDFYSKLLAKHHPHCKLPHSRHMTYGEFASSLRSMNDRWATTYSIDELISLAYIVDIDEQGVISYDAYLRFTCEVERAARSNINDPKESLDAMYDHRREVLYAHHVMTAIDLPELRDKLASIAVLASQCSLQPLQSLHELPVLADQDMSPNDSLIGFLLELSDVVNSSIDAEPDAQGSSKDDASYQLAGIGFDSPQPSSIPSDCHMMISTTIDSGMMMLQADADPGDSSDISFIKQPSACEDVTVPAPTAAVAEAVSDSVSAAASVSIGSNHSCSSYNESSVTHQEEDTPVEQPSAAVAAADDDDDALIIERNVEVTATTEHIDASMMGDADSELLSHTQTLLETINSIQKQAEEVSSSHLQRSLGSAEIAEKLDSLESELKQALEQMKALLAVKEADHSVEEERKHPDAQSNNTTEPLSPIDSKPVFADDDAPTPAPMMTRASSVAFLSGTPVALPPAVAAAASQSIATSPTPMLKPSTILSSRGGKAGPTATNRIVLTAASSSKYSHSQHDSLLSCQRGPSSSSSSSSSSVSTASGSTNRSMRRIDLDIFKSPRRFQTSLNRNTYSDSKLTWVPSQETEKAHARKRSDRFHSTEELMFARKVNQVFYKVAD